MEERIAEINRETKETNVKIELNLDGKGNFDIDTGIPFLDHMLSLFSKHGLFDLKIKAEGDLDVDHHHTNEDVGLTLGEVINKALGDRAKIKRFGFFSVPMDESLVCISLDLSNRPSLYINGNIDLPASGDYSSNDAKHFLNSMVTKLGANVHIDIEKGEDFHHTIEALFKCLAKVLDQATSIDKRIQGVPSTKGQL